MLRAWVIKRRPKLWVLWAASRPDQLLLIGLLYTLGIGMATAGSPIVAGDATHLVQDGTLDTALVSQIFVGALGLIAATLAIHYANEFADADTDALTDRTPFSGGSGALVETGLPAASLRRPLAVACTLTVVVALGGVVTAGLPPDAAGLLLVALAVGVGYSLPPVALVRRGYGEPTNMLLGGLVLPVYGISVVASPRPAAALAVVPFTLLVGCNLLAVHWPDRNADAAVGKQTLAVRWPPARLRQAFAVLAAGAGASTAGLWLTETVPSAVAVAHLVPVPLLVWGWTTLTRDQSPLPAVAAMVVLAVTTTVAWWWVGVGLI
ncbi:MAG: 1,4-dihydroxy-2-naphthoate octaprenyltransferase [halophilic archaeon J07HX5]|jgi:1,4-dihydroxy-2-naphthoate octaprenyltransferase|nr:MAG: 1,4-dihydroxy-2-naphthoate octaprenyltransferase [halophilic archaeon J07HX5]